MYRELINELSKDNAWTIIQPPATLDEIKEAEKFLGYEFPLSLKNLYLELNGDKYLILSLDEMKENVALKREYFPECFENYDEYLERSDRYIPFATNGCGDYYCFKVTADGRADESSVYIWEHELFESHPVAADITDTIIKYYNSEI